MAQASPLSGGVQVRKILYSKVQRVPPRLEDAVKIKSKLALLGLLALLCAGIVPCLGAFSANAAPPRLQEP
jgi:hypothetical protein